MYPAFKLPRFFLFHIFYLATIRTNSDELITGETHEFRDLSVPDLIGPLVRQDEVHWSLKVKGKPGAVKVNCIVLLGPCD